MVAQGPKTGRLPAGVGFALLAALLFGLSAPCAKLLLGTTPPLVLASLLYLGSGLGLSILRLWAPASTAEAALTRFDLPRLSGAILTGGVLGPFLLMWGLRSSSGSAASLLLNVEGVFTALLAWFVFHENYDRRVVFGFVLILIGGVLLSWKGGPAETSLAGSIAIAAACLCWAIDNNLTQGISGADPLQIAALKGALAGSFNLMLSLATGASWPPAALAAGALVVGLLGYGVSLVFFVLALRHLGTARTGAYFSLAPFFGAGSSLLLLRERVTSGLIVAGALMAAGAWLHLTERHEHPHHHERLEHTHRHTHDEHHQHAHPPEMPAGEPHTHPHVHEPITHRHPHYPDIHHRHRHA